MKNYHSLSRQEWDKTLAHLTGYYQIYAPVLTGEYQDYELINNDMVPDIVYNRPKPASPLKMFFLPVKENVINFEVRDKKRIIIGIPACDLTGAGILDEIYLNEDYMDPTYRKNREDTILIGSDCHSTQEHCHCTSYGVKPYPELNHDLTLSIMNGEVYLYTNSEKGFALIEEIRKVTALHDPTENDIQDILNKRNAVEEYLNRKNSNLPDYQETGRLVEAAAEFIWKKYSDTCVSCGACATICPTCTCFLLIEKTGFEKVRQMDACQYPGFERVAAGEDPLRELHKRFRNRYMCKYVWKPKKFRSIACTGCGRCIEACIGNISKNELFLELVNNKHPFHA